MTTVFTNLNDWRRVRTELDSDRYPVGFVPTMGALHDGHRALLDRARTECATVVCSIFVNPTQFDQPADLSGYPRTPELDLALVQAAGADYLLCPDVADLYPDGYLYRVQETDQALELEGACRPGHFDGMLTVVLKLLCLVRPQRAYFGEKDYQQYQLVRGLAAAFFLDTDIVACPTVRETDGLALSSRNRRLTPDLRRLAARFPELLFGSPDADTAAERLRAAGFRVEYVADRAGRRLGAVRLGEGHSEVRLIDNGPC